TPVAFSSYRSLLSLHTCRPPTYTLFPHTTLFRSQQEITATQQEIDQKQKLLTDFDTQLNTINHQEQELQTKLAVIKNNHANESRSEEHTSELQSRFELVCRLLLEKKNKTILVPLA